MQTFLPYPDFEETAKCLDMRRLGKQRVEAYQILRTLKDVSTGWKNHPAVKMWTGYEEALVAYGVVICREWIQRGYKDTLTNKIQDLAFASTLNLPPWLGDEKFHLSHKSNLTRKAPEWYSRFWDVPNDIPYSWPTKVGARWWIVTQQSLK